MPTLRASALVMTAVMRNNVRPDPQLPSRILRKVWPLALIVAVLMIAASTSIYLVSSFRGVLIGESLWSKAQKDAVYYLNSYVDSANPADLEKFRAALKIPAGDRAVLQALEKIPPDLDGAQAAALQGGIHADDVKSVVWLLHKFRHTSLMEEPMRYWRDGDRYLEQLKGLAREIREKHTHAQTTERDIATWKREITQINEGVTPATVAFSQALSDTSRRITLWLLLLNCVLAVGLVVLWALISRYTQRAREQAHAELQAEKERATTALASLGDAVITAGQDGVIDYVNPAGVSLLGLLESRIREKPLQEVLKFNASANSSEDDNLMALVLSGQHEWRDDQPRWLRRMDFSSVPVKVTGAQLQRNGEAAGVVIVLRDVSKEQQYIDKLSWHATHDNLTGLENRSEFEKRLQRLLNKGMDEARPAALLYIDLDQFKLINEASGPASGDEVLCEVCRLLLSNLRQTDTLARLGGDEFGVLLENCPPDTALRVADKLRLAAESMQVRWDSRTLRTGMSIGLVNINSDARSAEEIMRQADLACYRAKERGRSKIYVYRHEDGHNSRHIGDMDWITRIRSALEQDRFSLFAQSLAALQPGTYTGLHFEVLLRMRGDKGQLIMPSDFIPAAERYGIMPAIDRWVVSKTLATLSAHPDGTQGIDTCAINLSATSLNDDTLLEFLQGQLRKYDISPHILCFEITETGAIANLATATRLIESLRQLGCRFALDDFGVGMSSLTYLKQLPVDYVKIDGGFVRDMLLEPSNHAMVEMITHIGHILGKKTIAEFVESKDIASALQQIGVDYAQGYAIACPVPMDAKFLSPDAKTEAHMQMWQNTLTASI